MSEEGIYEALAQYLTLKHPTLIYRFDLGGIWTPSHRLRNLYAKVNARAWPDLHIAQPAGPYGGLFVEVKRADVRLRKRNGEWASDHIAEQAAVLDTLQARGFQAVFGVGFDDCVAILEGYLQPLAVQSRTAS